MPRKAIRSRPQKEKPLGKGDRDREMSRTGRASLHYNDHSRGEGRKMRRRTMSSGQLGEDVKNRREQPGILGRGRSFSSAPPPQGGGHSGVVRKEGNLGVHRLW